MDVAVDSLSTRPDLLPSTDTRDTAVGIGHGRRVLASSSALAERHSLSAGLASAG